MNSTLKGLNIPYAYTCSSVRLIKFKLSFLRPFQQSIFLRNENLLIDIHLLNGSRMEAVARSPDAYGRSEDYKRTAGTVVGTYSPVDCPNFFLLISKNQLL
jgi:hypothetical protein